MEQSNNISYLSKSNNTPQKITNLNITDYDCMIQAEYEYISGLDKDIYNGDFSEEDIEMLKNIKTNEVNNRRFKKWYKMSYSHDQIKILSKVDYDEISKSICKYSLANNNDNNTSIFKKLSKKNSISSISLPHQITATSTFASGNSSLPISQSEIGLRNYYIKKKAHFKSRVIKGPPQPFRITSWMICANLPIIRPSNSYWDLLQADLDTETENQINKDISRTMQGEEIIDNYGNNININGPLFRILKSIAIVDVDLSYCQGMNFICGFLLRITCANEVDTFYLVLSIFSNTFCDKYGIRGFYMDSFPLLKFYLYVFDLFFNKKMKKLHNKFTEIDFPQECWIGRWLQTLFVHIFPKNALLRVWDCILAKGLKILLSISLSILSSLETKLLKVEELTEINDIFKETFNSDTFDIEKIISNAIDKFYISKKEMIKFSHDYVSEGNSIGKNIKYDYQNIDLSKPEKSEDVIKKLIPCRKYGKTVKIKEPRRDIKKEDSEDDFEKEMSVTENGDDKRIMIHSIRSESFKMRNPFHN